MMGAGTRPLAVERWCQPCHGNLRRSAGKEFDLN